MIDDLRALYRWALARSKNSMTHLWANIVSAVSGLYLGAAWLVGHAIDLAAWFDPEINSQVVAVVNDADAHLAAKVSLGLMIVTKAARDRRAPFTGADPH